MSHKKKISRLLGTTKTMKMNGKVIMMKNTKALVNVRTKMNMKKSIEANTKQNKKMAMKMNVNVNVKVNVNMLMASLSQCLDAPNGTR
jgi:hypothetical protein